MYQKDYFFEILYYQVFDARKGFHSFSKIRFGTSWKQSIENLIERLKQSIMEKKIYYTMFSKEICSFLALQVHQYSKAKSKSKIFQKVYTL